MAVAMQRDTHYIDPVREQIINSDQGWRKTAAMGSSVRLTGWG